MFSLCLHRSESPSQVFLVVLKWLLNTLKEKPEETWGDVILCYDNMCHLDGLTAAKQPLPLPAPFDEMWSRIKKIIDSLHIRNHVDKRCKEVYSPESVKHQHPDYNTMAAEQTFVWLSRYKRKLAAMTKTHHLFYLHRMIKIRNRYTELCYRCGRKPLLPTCKNRNQEENWNNCSKIF